MGEIDEYIWLIKRCAAARDLEAAKNLHARISSSSHSSNRYLSNLLLQLFSTCNSLPLAFSVFRSISNPNTHSHNFLLSAIARNSTLSTALDFFTTSIPQRDIVTWSVLLNAHIQAHEFQSASHIFDRMPQWDLISCTSMISGEDLGKSKRLFDHMREGTGRNNITWTSLVSAAVQSRDFSLADEVFERMPLHEIICSTCMIQAGAISGNLAYSREIFFKRMKQRSLVAATAMISAFSQWNQVQRAAAVFDRVPERDVVSFNAMIQAFAACGQLVHAERVFDCLPERDLVSWNALATAYLNNSDAVKANLIFDRMPQRDIISWNAMLAAYARVGDLKMSEKIFREMPEIDQISSTNMIQACVLAGEFQQAERVFLEMKERSSVACTLMLTAYAQKGQLRNSVEIFDQMLERDAVAWTAMILAYAHNKKLLKAIETFDRVPRRFSTPLPCNAMINILCQNGLVDSGKEIFDEMQKRDLVSWNGMIAGYSQNARWKEAIELFQLMEQQGVDPDETTMSSILVSASRVGKNQGAVEQFRAMVQDHGIFPVLDHYHCVLDALGRAGQLVEAEELIESMPYLPDQISWTSLLSACRIHKDSLRAARVAPNVFVDSRDQSKAFLVDGDLDAPYTLISNIVKENFDLGR